MDLDRSEAAEVERKRLMSAFRRLIAPKLRELGFRGRAGHFIRRVAQVDQVIEIQTSVYGQRFTVNLGLDLPWLKPAARWVARPKLGPQAHDCVRWIRLGLVLPDGKDLWWSFETDEALEQGCHELGEILARDGVAWLEGESTQAAFFKYALERVDRSKSTRYPYGRYAELRLFAAVLAWHGRWEEAKATCEQARAFWGDERDRLTQACVRYGKAFPNRAPEPSAVPDLQAELDKIVRGSLR